MNLERAIFNNLLNNETYARKTIPFLKPEYFHNRNDKVVFELINAYVMEYNAFPTKEAMLVDLNNRDNISEDQFKECKEIVEEIPDQSEHLSNVDWLVDQTEKFCQDKAIYNAIMASIQVMDDKSGKLSKGSIPQLLSDALAVSFDTSIGHDFIEDAESRFEFYHRKEERLPFDIDYLNKITRGGLPRKTLNILLAGTGVGKTLAMCHFAASYTAAGKNVLYITMEMAEEKIAERIDANLLNVPLDELSVLPKESYDKKMTRLKEKTTPLDSCSAVTDAWRTACMNGPARKRYSMPSAAGITDCQFGYRPSTSLVWIATLSPRNWIDDLLTEIPMNPSEPSSERLTSPRALDGTMADPPPRSLPRCKSRPL